MSHEGISLPADQEAQARELAAAITQLAEEELLQIARTLVAAQPADLYRRPRVPGPRPGPQDHGQHPTLRLQLY
jgi:hypothetical protein